MHTVWLIRHGESQSDAGQPTISPDLTQLTRRGNKQAEAILSAFLSSLRVPSLVVISKFKRTQQTAQPTIRYFRNACKEDKWPVHEFTYLSSKHSLCTSKQERYQQVQQFWNVCNPAYRDAEDAELDKGVESFEQFITRAYGVIEQLQFSKEDFIAVFTHGQFIQAIWWLLDTRPTSLSKEAYRQFCAEHPIPNGAIVPIEIHGRDELVVKEMLTSHLNQIITGESSEDTTETAGEPQEQRQLVAAH